MKLSLSNILILFILILLSSCQLNEPRIDQFTMQPNLFKGLDGKITEFFSIQVDGYDKDGSNDMVLVRISHYEEKLFWHLERSLINPNNFTSSFLYGPNLTLPRGLYTIDLFDAADHVATTRWNFTPPLFKMSELIFPLDRLSNRTEEPIFLFIYSQGKFVVEYLLKDDEPLPSLLDNEIGYLYYFNTTIGYGLLQAYNEASAKLTMAP